MSHKYHQLLKYVYFEGYANSYEEAEYLLGQLSDEEFHDLCEGVFSSKSSGAISADAADEAAAKFKTAADSSPSNRKRYRDAAARHKVTARRLRKTNEECVVDYLVNEGYSDNYNSAEKIYESMSDEWLDSILEVTGGGRVTRSNYRERGMQVSPDMKAHMKKAQLDDKMERRANEIKASVGSQSSHRDEDDDEGGYQPRRTSPRQKEKQNRKKTLAAHLTKTDSKMQKLEKRHAKIDNVERNTNWN